MPLLIPTVCQYIAENRKKDGFWVNFNTVYNDIHAFKKFDKYKDNFRKVYLKEEYTDKEKQKEFLDFMKTNFPDVKLVPVFDLVDPGYLKWPYLGSYLVDADVGSDVYNALVDKFEENGKPKDNRLVIWVLPYERAKKYWEDRIKGWENF